MSKIVLNNILLVRIRGINGKHELLLQIVELSCHVVGKDCPETKVLRRNSAKTLTSENPKKKSPCADV